ncbi:MAG: DUF3416 domain-containing protein, partial [Gemmatales bacterium]|nr:DUF3416 domain-containing protein [Gemmatales bacterium]MDW8176841.1 DUF3416 domain-containing protein [Gemmatales bacterium]
MTPRLPDAQRTNPVTDFPQIREQATPIMQRCNQARTFFENIRPSVEGGRYPIKRELGDVLTVEADVFREGHDVLAVRLLYRHERER